MKFRLMQQAAPRKWKRALRAIEQDLEQGRLFTQIVETPGSRPRELQCLLNEALKVPDPAKFLMAAIDVRQRAWQRWRDLGTVLAYPIALLCAAFFFSTAVQVLVHETVDFQYIEDLQIGGFQALLAQWEDQQQAVIGVSAACIWVLLTGATIYFLGPPWAWLAVAGSVIAVGKPLRWISLHEILARYQLFFDQSVPTAKTAEAVAASFKNSAQGAVAKQVASRIQEGVPLGKAFGECQLADPLCRPVLLMLDSSSQGLSQRLEQVNTLLASLADQRCRTLEALLPPVVLLLIALILWSLMSSYLVMISAILPLLRWGGFSLF